ncbi:hypothetical protein R1sor_020252 [Riccia sorocarpa]|uniref:J domain-containing protein n=1 Tax=Riccia sorocarpa TaxID=122646 RepID=A0ABD3IIM6_9MARC
MTPRVLSSAAAILYRHNLTSGGRQQRRWYGSSRDSLSAAYAQLGLPASASLDEVKGAYRRLALKWSDPLSLLSSLYSDPVVVVLLHAAFSIVVTLKMGVQLMSSSMCHPDLNEKDGQEFVRITAAYQRIVNRSAVYSNSGSGFRRYSGPVVYAQSSTASSFTPKAAAVWGFGLAMGCVFFGAVLLWARAELMQTALHRSGPSRVVEPTSDSLKRERIHALLMEKTRAKDAGKDQRSQV